MNKLKILITIFIIISFNIVIKLNANDDTYIIAENIIYNEKENTVELSKNSKINTNDISLLIDKGIIDYNNDKVEVFGNFYLYENLNILSGFNLKGNTTLTNFKAENVNYIYNNDLKIDSKEISRINKNIYLYDNFLTPCEIDGFFNCPTWSLRIDKTYYDFEKDKFSHYDTFLQIADYKVFYIPYFSHYGSKAPRQKGFLTPTIEFAIQGNASLKTPYYAPLKKNIDVLVTPKFTFDNNLEFTENYNLNTLLNGKLSGGEFNLEIDNIKNKNSKNINTSSRFNTSQVLNENMILSINSVFTNSISTTRSINEEPLTFEDVYLKLENYNFLKKDDYLSSEISTVESFDASEVGQIPLIPNFKYHNRINIHNKLSMLNNLNFIVIRRNNSTNENPLQSNILNFKNEFIYNNNFTNFHNFNRIIFNGSINKYNFDHDPGLNSETAKYGISLSSDNYYKISNYSKFKIKNIINQELVNNKSQINEDSKSFTFNYINQFSENRLFGHDLNDNSNRIIYAFENKLPIHDNFVKFKINQSYDFSQNGNYTKEINQYSKFSDYAIETSIDFENISLQLDSRNDHQNFEKKEMNYSIKMNKPVEISLNYNETKKSAFREKSSDTKSLNLDLSKKINDNLSISYGSNIDLKNNFSPFSQYLSLNVSDECSNLIITYSNSRFNDDYNTSPEEKVSLNFYMDYLGFFGYEQQTNLFFEEPGNFNYGL